mgnify:CR=1 FL=1
MANFSHNRLSARVLIWTDNLRECLRRGCNPSQSPVGSSPDLDNTYTETIDQSKAVVTIACRLES